MIDHHRQGRRNVDVPLSRATTPKRVNTAARSSNNNNNNKRSYRVHAKWVTRDMASLDFLLHIPLAAEASIVQTGYQLQLQRDTASPRPPSWWEASSGRRIPREEDAPEQPNDAFLEPPLRKPAGRRLQGDAALRIQIPLSSASSLTLTNQKSIARQAALREWERQTAWGGRREQQPPLLDGRLFWSANSSYPVAVSSVLRYEPRKEEAAFRRRKLEAIGGGGNQFVLPDRDWRGISYRALLRKGGGEASNNNKQFNRFVRRHIHDSDASDASSSSSSSLDSNHYVPGLLDDPEMVLGRHRTVMIGDRVTGPMVSSTIQFVKPAVLKAELNKQFRERFDGWEPPKKARKYIGAQVIQGNYVLIDPTEGGGGGGEYHVDTRDEPPPPSSARRRQGSVGSSNEAPAVGEKTIRMPPSLTLSKIRSLKSQALKAAVKANLEIGTVALACVYFERLCLEGRVDKSNRRISFAACWLLAAKINEPNVVALVTEKDDRLQSMIRPGHRSNTMFASLLLFFTQDWALSLQQVFTAEWCVFAALRFSLDATPSQVAFHFRRLLKTLEWQAAAYLGATMYQQWQDVLAAEEEKRPRPRRPTAEFCVEPPSPDPETVPSRRAHTPPRRRTLWFTGGRSWSTEHLEEEPERKRSLLPLSPSMPDISRSIPVGDDEPLVVPLGEEYNDDEEEGIVL